MDSLLNNVAITRFPDVLESFLNRDLVQEADQTNSDHHV